MVNTKISRLIRDPGIQDSGNVISSLIYIGIDVECSDVLYEVTVLILQSLHDIIIPWLW
jgi:hypothetical protein